ncbi:MAG: carboxypeptidase regulatory-like domain-containing protein [Vicinamibacterales bacterium]
MAIPIPAVLVPAVLAPGPAPLLARRRRLLRTILLLSVFASTGVAAGAQSTDATLTGTVKDTTGAVLPGVTITVRSTGTNETRTTVSADDGKYRVTNLPRGDYEVQSELAGFKSVVQADVRLTVGDTVRLDFTLELGSVQETVTVTSQATLINTEEARLSYLVDEKRVSELPLNGRNVMQLIELQPGSVANPGNAVLGGSAGGDSAFVNGQRNRANNFLLDGTDNNDQFTAGRTAVNPSVDTIQEFRVATNTFSAEFGRNSASAVLVVTKSGTNQFKGTAYEFLRNDALDARSVFAAKKDPLRFNQFGTTAGGPIRKNKTFFFASYEGQRVTRGQTVIRTVETPEFRDLVIRQYPNSIAALLFKNFPSPTPTTNLRDVGRPVPGLATDSARNTPGVTTNPNYVASGSLFTNQLQATPDGIPDIGTAAIPVVDTTHANQFGVKIDQEISGSMRAFGRYLRDQNRASDNLTIVRSGFDQPIDIHASNTTGGFTWVVSNRVVNDTRFGWSRRERGLLANNAGVPGITFDDGVIGFGNNPTNPAVFEQDTLHWTDTLSMNLGDHSIKLGGEYRNVRDNSNFAVRRPAIAFNNILDFANDEPRGVTNIGINPGTGLIETNVRHFRFNELGLFFQDDWKVRSNLTLNLGLRYDWFGRPSETSGLLTNMIPGPGADIFEQVRTATVGRVDQVVPDDFNDFAPRLGVTWDPRDNGHFVVRGGWGIAYERLFNNSITNIRFNPPFYSFAVANPVNVASQAGIPIFYGPTNGAAPSITGPNTNPGVRPELELEGNIIGWDARFGTSQQSLRVPDPFGKDAFSYSWFTGVQYQLSRDWAAEANYVGSLGRNYGRLVDYNTVRGDLFDGRLDRLNPTFGGINFRAMLAHSEYHGGQFQLTKRYSRGYSAQLSYTVGRARDNGSDVQVGGLPVDARDLELEWAATDFDVRHRFVANALWEVPFMRDATGWKRALLGGWQLNTIVALQSGFPFNVNTTRPYGSGGDFNGDGVNNDRPNLPTFGLDLANRSNDAYINGVFKASDFPTTGFVIGSLPRNAYRGPGYRSTDLSLFKNFQPVASGYTLQFRLEAFNAFNGVNLRNPNGNLAQATFGRSTQSFPGREVQVALKFIW